MWSDNEYDMSLSNKLHGVMGLDELSDDIISAEFPDEDVELFDAKEFIDLNTGPDTDMGLNFQARQA